MLSVLLPAQTLIIQQSTSLDDAHAAAASMQRMLAFALYGQGYFKQFAFNTTFKYLESHREACTNDTSRDLSAPDIVKLQSMVFAPTHIHNASSVHKSSNNNTSSSQQQHNQQQQAHRYTQQSHTTNQLAIMTIAESSTLSLVAQTPTAHANTSVACVAHQTTASHSVHC